jgi:hypothetical protein
VQAFDFLCPIMLASVDYIASYVLLKEALLFQVIDSGSAVVSLGFHPYLHFVLVIQVSLLSLSNLL